MTGLRAPELPAHISANGAEIWDWAAKFSDWTHKQARIRELNADILRIGLECGSCKQWMTRSCPKERNVNGHNRGPSMKAPKCGQFVMAASSEQIRQRWIDERDAIALAQSQEVL